MLTAFATSFAHLTGHDPLPWQIRLFDTLATGHVPAALDLPTGLGKTSVMAIWLLARVERPSLPRRLVYVVDRRAVVDQASIEAQRLRENLTAFPEIHEQLGDLHLSTLRGQLLADRGWMERPDGTAIVVGTVDMVGSRLLFSGYGVSPRMRPVPAALMGQDTLLVIDEAHLAPAFSDLVSDIAEDTGLWSTEAMPVAPLRVMRLSATQRMGGDAFRLDEEDRRHPVVQARTGARKGVDLREGAPSEAGPAVLELAECEAARIVVFLDSRREAEKLADELGKAGVQPILFTGARRPWERTLAEDELRKAGFLAGSAPSHGVSVLVATAAAEVGVDLDADHAVMDLVAWERMVQRLGRVNRRGAGTAKVIMLDGGEAISPGGASLDACRGLIGALDGEASPEVLRRAAEGDPARVRDASTPAPLRPPLSRAAVEAWAMTGLADHAGRADDIRPWLRGWIEDMPRARLVWRCYLPVREGDDPVAIEQDAFFEAAPVHLSEVLETEHWAAMDWLGKRIARLMKTHDQSAEAALTGTETLAMTLSDGNNVSATWTLADLRELFRPKSQQARETQRRRAEFEALIQRDRLVLDARIGGVREGLLDPGTDAPAPAADDGQSEAWSGLVGFTVEVAKQRAEDPDDEGSLEPSPDRPEQLRFACALTATGEPARELVIRTTTGGTTDSRNDGRARGRWLSLYAHTADVEAEAATLAKRLGLSEENRDILAHAARLHDRGKAARGWQRAMGGEQQPGGPWAKTPSGNGKALAGYRHEFGSLLEAEGDAALEDLHEIRRDLVLHLVASHHGLARPFMPATGVEALPPSAAERRSAAVALRFARLMRAFGPWGLAWWEAVFRAADWRASANPGRSANG